jgi:hypothetical protein
MRLLRSFQSLAMTISNTIKCKQYCAPGSNCRSTQVSPKSIADSYSPPTADGMVCLIPRPCPVKYLPCEMPSMFLWGGAYLTGVKESDK